MLTPDGRHSGARQHPENQRALALLVGGCDLKVTWPRARYDGEAATPLE